MRLEAEAKNADCISENRFQHWKGVLDKLSVILQDSL